LEISAKDWAALSSLVDEALDRAPAARTAWLAESENVRALTDDQRRKLEHLIAQSNATDAGETNELLATLPQFALKAHREFDSFAGGDRVGPYELIEKIGTGGMSEVWRARRCDGAYEREVALKLPYAHANAASRDHFIRRMERERDLLARLEHPNIARFYDAGIAKTELGAQPYLALEYVEGESLIDYANHQRLTIEARCRLFLQVLDAVQYAHQRFVVHRDLKPSNILVRTSGSMSGRVALLDFGIAKVLDEETQIGEATMLTREMGRAITLAYASPEQLLSEPITTASDVYSAGVLFYELLCGQRPFAGRDHSMMSLLGVLETPPPSPTSVIRNAEDVEPSQFGAPSRKALTNTLTGDLAAIVAKSLRRDALLRYISASAFAEDLQRYLTNQPVQAREGARLYAVRKFLRRQRVPLATGFVVTVVGLAFAVHTLTQRQILRESASQVESVERLINGMLDGMSPAMAETRTFTAKELLDRAVKALPSEVVNDKDDALIERLAALYVSIGAHDRASKLTRERIARLDADAVPSERARLLMKLASSELQHGATKEAGAALNEVDELLPQFSSKDRKLLAEYHRLRGWYALHLQDLKLATTEFDRFEQYVQAPGWIGSLEHGKYLSQRAYIAREQRKFSDAERYYRASIQNCEAVGVKCFDYLLQTKKSLASTLVDAKKFSVALELAPSLATEIEKRYGEASEMSLDAHYVLAAAKLYSGNLADARVTATRMMSFASVSEPHSLRYRLFAQKLLIEAALIDSPVSVAQREIDNWLDPSKFDVPEDMLSKIEREQFASYWRAAALMKEGKDLQANNLLRVLTKAVDKKERRKVLSPEYLLAISEIRLGNEDEALRLFEDMRNRAATIYGEEDSTVLLVDAHLEAVNWKSSPMSVERKRQLQSLLGWHPNLRTLLVWRSEHLSGRDWYRFPFVYFDERS
jgi:serine/threonine protein kinase